MHKLDALDQASLRTDVPAFRAGDTLKVHVKVIEGTRSRVQVFQGVVIRRHGGGIGETFTARASCHSSWYRKSWVKCRSPKNSHDRPRRLDGAALLHEGAERRDAGAGADHDDVGRRVGRQAEVAVRLQADPELGAVRDPVGDVDRGDARARPAVGLVAHRGDGEVDLVADFLARGGDRVGARRQRPGDACRGARRSAPPG